MLGHCIEMYIGDTDAYIGRMQLDCPFTELFLALMAGFKNMIIWLSQIQVRIEL